MAEELLTLDPNIVSSLVINGDLSKLTPTQKVDYYNYRCFQAGLDPAAKPFDLLSLNGKQILYANAGATQQLTANRKLSSHAPIGQVIEGIYCVPCKVTDPEGRYTENVGAVTIDGLKGDARANAMMKATTKAIRRTVLAHCGLGMMDESEVETIPGAKIEPLPTLGTGVTTAKSGLKPTIDLIERELATLECPLSNPWTIELCETYTDLIQEQMYSIFSEVGHPEAYEGEAAKWRARRASDSPDKVIPALQARITELQGAAAKAKAKAKLKVEPKAITWKPEDDQRFDELVEQISTRYRDMQLFDDLETFRQNVKDAKADTAPGKMLLSLADHLVLKTKEVEEFKKGGKPNA